MLSQKTTELSLHSLPPSFYPLIFRYLPLSDIQTISKVNKTLWATTMYHLVLTHPGSVSYARFSSWFDASASLFNIATIENALEQEIATPITSVAEKLHGLALHSYTKGISNTHALAQSLDMIDFLSEKIDNTMAKAVLPYLTAQKQESILLSILTTLSTSSLKNYTPALKRLILFAPILNETKSCIFFETIFSIKKKKFKTESDKKVRFEALIALVPRLQENALQRLCEELFSMLSAFSLPHTISLYQAFAHQLPIQHISLLTNFSMFTDNYFNPIQLYTVFSATLEILAPRLSTATILENIQILLPQLGTTEPTVQEFLGRALSALILQLPTRSSTLIIQKLLTYATDPTKPSCATTCKIITSLTPLLQEEDINSFLLTLFKISMQKKLPCYDFLYDTLLRFLSHPSLPYSACLALVQEHLQYPNKYIPHNYLSYKIFVALIEKLYIEERTTLIQQLSSFLEQKKAFSLAEEYWTFAAIATWIDKETIDKNILHHLLTTPMDNAQEARLYALAAIAPLLSKEELQEQALPLFLAYPTQSCLTLANALKKEQIDTTCIETWATDVFLSGYFKEPCEALTILIRNAAQPIELLQKASKSILIPQLVQNHNHELRTACCNLLIALLASSKNKKQKMAFIKEILALFINKRQSHDLSEQDLSILLSLLYSSKVSLNLSDICPLQEREFLGHLILQRFVEYTSFVPIEKGFVDLAKQRSVDPAILQALQNITPDAALKAFKSAKQEHGIRSMFSSRGLDVFISDIHEQILAFLQTDSGKSHKKGLQYLFVAKLVKRTETTDEGAACLLQDVVACLQTIVLAKRKEVIEDEMGFIII